MLLIKPFTGLSLLLISHVAFSGSMGQDGYDTSPYQNTGILLGIDALYLETNLPAFNSPTSIEQYIPYLAPYVALPSSWGFGFKVQGAYRFSNANDINLSWIHLKNDYSQASRQSTPVGGLLHGSSHLEPSFNTINLEYGQHLDFNSLSIRFEGSLQYARLSAERTLNAVYVYTSNIYPIDSTSSGLFQGLGPRGGVNVAYHTIYGIGAAARGDVGLIIGHRQSLQSPNRYSRLNIEDSSYTVVPELELSAEVNYAYPMAYGNLSANLGWMWINYFNAQTYRDVYNTMYSETREANYGLQGLYFGLKWQGNLT